MASQPRTSPIDAKPQSSLLFVRDRWSALALGFMLGFPLFLKLIQYDADAFRFIVLYPLVLVWYVGGPLLFDLYDSFLPASLYPLGLALHSSAIALLLAIPLRRSARRWRSRMHARMARAIHGV